MKTIDPDIGSLMSSPGLRARTARPWGPGLQARIPIFCTSKCRLQARRPIFCTARCKHIGRRPIFCTARCKIHEKRIFQYLFLKLPKRSRYLCFFQEKWRFWTKYLKPGPCKISKFQKLGNRGRAKSQKFENSETSNCKSQKLICQICTSRVRK